MQVAEPRNGVGTACQAAQTDAKLANTGPTVTVTTAGQTRTGNYRMSDGNRTLQYPKDRASLIVSDDVVFDVDEVGRLLEGTALEAGRRTREPAGQIQLMRRVRGTGDEYAFLPYLTRFNSVERAMSSATASSWR